MTGTLPRLVARLDRFIDCAAAVWADYLTHGPGRLSASAYEPVQSAAEALDQTLHDTEVIAFLQQVDVFDRHQIAQIAHRLDRLARSCACTRHGLCFITGEAGLIPRTDQHKMFESYLAELREITRRIMLLC